MKPLFRAGLFLPLAFLAMLVGESPALEPPMRIMPLGDSLTYGEALTTVEGGYRNRLHELLTAADFNVDFIGTYSDTNNPTLPDPDHQGWPGARTDQLRGALDGWLARIEDPDVVLLLIGTNDIWQDNGAATTLANLDALIDDIAVRQPFAKIIVSTLPRRTDSTTYENLQLQYNAGIPAIVAQHAAEGRQVTMLDMHPVLTPFDYSSDGVHPSTPGYQKMGTAWDGAVRALTTAKGDANPPVIARVETGAGPTELTVVFSKPVADGAANPAFYQLSGGVSVTGAALDAFTKRTVTLTTSPQTPGLLGTLTVGGVKDRTPQQNSIAPESMVDFSANVVSNGGFEDFYAGWTATGNQDVTEGDPYVASQGTRMVAFNDANLPPGGTLAQTFNTVPGATYQLSFDTGVLAYNTNEQRLQVNVQGSGSLLSETITVKLPAGTSSGVYWTPRAYSITANSALTTITFTDTSTVTNGIDLLLDNVRLQAPIGRRLAVTSSPTTDAWMTVSPNDNRGAGDGQTGLIRDYAPDTEVTVTAPATHNGRSFFRWRKNGVLMPASGNSITLAMDTDYALDAVYISGNPPVAAAESHSTPAGTPLAVGAPGVLMNDTEPDGAPLAAVLVSPPGNGSLTLNTDGSFDFTPGNGFSGQTSFTYLARGPVLDSAPVTVTLHVLPVGTQLAQNGGFESTFTGWTVSGNLAVQTSSSYSPTEGTRCVSFNTGNQTPNGVLSQTIATVAGMQYRLTFDAGVYAKDPENQTLRVTLDDSSNLLDQTLALSGNGGWNTTWQSRVFEFTANSNSTLLRFRDLSTKTRNVDLMLDNVRIEPVVPLRSLAIGSMPTGQVVVGVSPADTNGSAGNTTPFSLNYPEGSIVNLSAPAMRNGMPFVKWKLNGADFSTARNVSVAMDANATLDAVYQSQSNTPPFDEWAAFHGIDPVPDADDDGDSLKNAVEYAVGGDPEGQADAALLPYGELLPGVPAYRFSYRLAHRAQDDPSTQVSVEWATNPAGPWTTADGTHGETEQTVTGAEVDLIHVTIPLPAGAERFFARLAVTVMPEP